MRYPANWSAGLKGEEKTRTEEMLTNNNLVLDRLTQICYNMIKESESVSNDYDSPNWPLRAADSVGYRRALERIIKLCTPKQDNA
jgi:hypothetical protein